jgi:glycosyltransferase involved in cell wall biosynthesis
VFETILSGYKNVGLFVSPNTSELSPEHADILSQCQRAFVPSNYCAQVVRDTLRMPIEVCPLGVPDEYAKRRFERRAGGQPFTFLHLTTDFYLPGRKGTNEVVEAWKIVRGALPEARLVVHVPESISTQLYYALADQEREDGHGYGRFSILSPPARGTTESDLAELLCSADAVVLPSRCEGFGMVILAALVLGVPLITTDVTGQCDFLADFRSGPLGFDSAFLLAPTLGEGPLVGEDGPAPLIDVEGLAQTMLCMHDSYSTICDAARLVPDAVRQKWTWSSVLNIWSEKLQTWENT